MRKRRRNARKSPRGLWQRLVKRHGVKGAKKEYRKARRGRAVNRKRKWISKAIKRPGALRRKFSRWYGLKPNQKIPASMYAKGYKRAKKRGDTRTMRQINLAKTLSRMDRKRKRRRKTKVIRGVRFGAPRRRKIAANRGRRMKRRRRRRSA